MKIHLTHRKFMKFNKLELKVKRTRIEMKFNNN